MPQWFADNELLVWWVIAISAGTFVLGAVLLPIIIVLLPEDYFCHQRRPLESLESYHPAVRISLLVLKNVLGLALLLAGLVMLVTPGSGIIALLAGLTLMDLPGKRRLEQRIVRQRQVNRLVNQVRQKLKRPPFQLPEESECHSQASA